MVNLLKTSDPIINCEDDDLLILKDEQTLLDASISKIFLKNLLNRFIFI